MCPWVNSDYDSIYPYEDGFDDDVIFYSGVNNLGSYTSGGSGVLVILNSANEEVWASSSVTGTQYNQHVWDGTDAQGIRVPFGLYSVQFEFTVGQSVYTSPAIDISVVPTDMDYVDLTASVNKVFPVADGYKDAVRFFLDGETVFGEDEGGGGSLKISKQGSNKVAKLVNFSGVGYSEIVWNGKLENKIVPGLYNVKLTMRAEEGVAVSTVMVVEVSAKKLVTKTAVLQRTARQAFPYIESYDYSACTYSGGTVYGDTWGLDALCYGSIGIPSAVLAGRQIGNVSVEVTLKVVSPIYGNFGFWTADTTTGGMKIISSTGTKKLNMGYLVAGYSRLQLQMYMPEFSTGTVSSVKVKFTYKALQ